MSVSHPLFPLFSLLSSKGDVKFILCSLTFCVVILVLAYLTNPSESSFRAYLTEQSFRHHLSHLDRFDDGVDDGTPLADAPASSIASNRPSAYAFSFENPTLLHFAARASVSLRTPRHAFHSFAIFTVATMLPMATPGQCEDNHLSSTVADSWYIGAFGRWWRGGIIETWYQDVIARSKDEESRCSGILSLSNVDVRHDYAGLPVPPHGISLSSPYRSTIPKLRNRERPSQRTSALPGRCDTPPPLPKSASLPLHTSCPNVGRISWPPTLHTSPLSTLPRSRPPLQQSNGAASAEILLDHSPRIAELLRQIAQTQGNVEDLRVQLSDCKSTNSQSRTHLQDKVDAHRERRRQEDTVKMELKSRTKSLDDSKRQAESLKREVEKKLKVAQNARTSAKDCLSFFDKNINQVQEEMANDRDFVNQQSLQQSSLIRSSATEQLEVKRREIKVTEVQISSLSHRARELESQLNDARERLKLLRHRGAIRKAGVQQLVDDRRIQSWSEVLEQSANSITGILEEQVPPERLEHCIDKVEGSLATLERPSFTYADSNCSPVAPHRETALSNDISGRVFHSSDRRASISSTADVIASQESAPFYPLPSPKPILLSCPESTPTYPYVVDTSAYQDNKEIPLNGPINFHCDRTESKLESNISSPGWVRSPDHEHVAARAENGSAGQNDWHLHEKGFSPDTQEFNRGSQTGLHATAGRQDGTSSHNALSPHGFRTSAGPSAATSSPSLLRAFAPSPAERQVFQRALGGASNTVLERLPSLGDVGRIPIPPSPLAVGDFGDVLILSRALPSWLLLPQNHQVNFSPWDDDEQEQSP